MVDPTVFFYRLLPYYKLLSVTLLFNILYPNSTYALTSPYADLCICHITGATVSKKAFRNEPVLP